MLNLRINSPREYENWYDFKRALETRLGKGLPVDMWLRLKPRKPFPWTDVDLRTVFSECTRIQKSSNDDPVWFRRTRVNR